MEFIAIQAPARPGNINASSINSYHADLIMLSQALARSGNITIAEVIAELNPTVKLILSLRNPVDRTYAPRVHSLPLILYPFALCTHIRIRHLSTLYPVPFTSLYAHFLFY